MKAEYKKRKSKKLQLFQSNEEQQRQLGLKCEDPREEGNVRKFNATLLLGGVSRCRGEAHRWWAMVARTVAVRGGCRDETELRTRHSAYEGSGKINCEVGPIFCTIFLSRPLPWLSHIRAEWEAEKVKPAARRLNGKQIFQLPHGPRERITGIQVPRVIQVSCPCCHLPSRRILDHLWRKLSTRSSALHT